MKRVRRINFTLAVLLLVVPVAFHPYASYQSSEVSGFAVVELFTSEGCSSCPAADAAVARLGADFKTNLYVLAFHVDYWNYLGWKDVFSSSFSSERQRKYGDAFNLKSIYTPQIIVNGKIQFVGSDETLLRKSIEHQLEGKKTSAITLEAKSNVAKNILVSFKVGHSNSSIVNICLVQHHGASFVKGGENEGLELHHFNIVRDFKTSSENEGILRLAIPPGISRNECSVIAFIQNKKDMHITDAKESSIQ